MKKSIICHLTSAHQPNDVRIFFKEASSLAASGYKVFLIAPTEKNYESNGVNIISVCRRNNRLSRMILTVREVYKKAIEIDADVYHFHDPELLRIALKLKNKGKKVIYDVHEDVPLQIMSKFWINPVFRKLISKSFDRYEKSVSGKLDGIVAATSFIANKFLPFNPHTIILNNYPFLNEFSPVSELQEKQNQVLYIGGITVIRGIKEMVKAMERVSETKLILAGLFAPKELQIEMEQTIGWEKVEYKGQLNRYKIKELLSKSIAGLVVLHDRPNYIDAQPIKMFEYMSAGIPVIASDFPLWKSVVDGNNCGICVNPFDIEGIANAIQYLVTNKEKAKEMGQNGRRAIEEKYNWEQEKIKLVYFYDQMMQTNEKG